MKSKSVYFVIGALLVSLTVFAVARKKGKAASAGKTLVMQSVFTPTDKKQPVRMGETRITSVTSDGSHIVERTTSRGDKHISFPEGDQYLSHKIGDTVNIKSGNWRVITPEIIAARFDKLKVHKDFVRTETVKGIECAVLVRYSETGQKKTQWVSPEFGTIQYEQEYDTGVERMDVLANLPIADESKLATLPLRLPQKEREIPAGAIK